MQYSVAVHPPRSAKVKSASEHFMLLLQTSGISCRQTFIPVTTRGLQETFENSFVRPSF